MTGFIDCLNCGKKSAFEHNTERSRVEIIGKTFFERVMNRVMMKNGVIFKTLYLCISCDGEFWVEHYRHPKTPIKKKIKTIDGDIIDLVKPSNDPSSSPSAPHPSPRQEDKED